MGHRWLQEWTPERNDPDGSNYMTYASGADLCGTPGTKYSTSFSKDRRKIVLTISLPKEMECPPEGSHGEAQLIKRLHAGVLQGVEWLFGREWWRLKGKTIDSRTMPEAHGDLFYKEPHK